MTLMLSGTLGVVAQEAKPVDNPASWISTDDYPAAALREGMEGTTAVQMSISAEGDVTGCTVTATSGHPILDDLTCNLLSLRAKYAPAKDRNGRAMASQDDRRVHWRMPYDADGNPIRNPRPQPFAMTVDFEINEDGEMENCQTRWQSGATSHDYCEEFPDLIEPFVDDEGQPVRKRITLRNSLTVEDIVEDGGAASPAPSTQTPPPN